METQLQRRSGSSDLHRPIGWSTVGWAVVMGAVSDAVLIAVLPAEGLGATMRAASPVAATLGFAAMAAVCTTICIRLQRADALSGAPVAVLVTLALAVVCAATVAGMASSLARVPRFAEFAVFCACAGACTAAVIIYLMSSHIVALRVSRLLTVVTLLLSFAAAAVLVWDLPLALFACSAVAFGLYCLQSMPNLVVRVPDRYLLEWRAYMSERWSVRMPIPAGGRVLTDADITADLLDFRIDYATGTALATFTGVSGFVMESFAVDVGSLYATVGYAVLGVSAALYLLLKPRASGRSRERYVMRCAGMAIACTLLVRLFAVLWSAPSQQFGGRGHLIALLAVIAVGVVGLAMGFAMIVQNAGLHSLVLSRIGDAVAMVSCSLIMPSAFFAAGCFELLRGAGW